MCLAVPHQVVSTGDGTAVTLRRGDRLSTASLLAADEPLEAGDWVLVHSGLVLCKLTADDVADYDRLLSSGGAS